MNDNLDHHRDDRLERLFRSEDAPPKDVVPASGLTREDLLAQNAAAGSWSEVVQPGEIVVDVDGMPIGVTPSERRAVYVGGACVTPGQLAGLGLTPADVPNLKIMPDLTAPNQGDEDA